jgi:plasmid maintenance system antidote protein VapI
MVAKKVVGDVHPGEILLDEFLEPLEISRYRLAKGVLAGTR